MIERKKTNINAMISILVFLLIAVFSFGLTACSSSDEKTNTKENAAQENVNNFSAETINTSHVLLTMSQLSTTDSGTISRTITATVLPATATNKAIDWSVEWGDSSNTATVTDYVIVTPDSDGSATATVTCKKAFTGNIIVTATTRESGYTASCMVTFVGIPTDISISGSVSPDENKAYNLGIGQAYTFNVAPVNPFNSVGSSYNNITCSVTGIGSVVLGNMEHYNSSGNDKWFDTYNKTVTLDSLKDNFIKASYSNGKLIVTTIKSIESYYASVERLDSGRTKSYTDKFRSFVDDCYFTVTVSESTSRVSKVMIIRFNDTVVTGIEVNLNDMIF